ncbi:unnamed protein product [Clonostachys solani]|uniref:Glutaminase A n=1 Tax=Clonostachys solani TaxID=160281 RepID=A0A9N9W624_9HYPO|nr:unnamed protein product [Clonostachys solani]
MNLIIGAVLAAALAQASSLTPPVLPLIVRNPYLSTWLPHAREAPWSHWPMFWAGHHIGFSVMVSLPDTNTIYPLLGRPQDSLPDSSPNFTVSEPSDYEVSFDAVTTNLTYTLQAKEPLAKSTKVTISFLSPITPTSTLRQSLPAAYFTISIQGKGPVNVYTDVNGEWVSGNRDNTIIWELSDLSSAKTKSPSTKSWKVRRETEQHFTETSDKAEWGTLYFTSPENASHEAGTSAILRNKFAVHGRLSNQTDSNFRRIMEEEPVFAFSHVLDSSSSSITFSLGLVQDPVVQFAAARGLTLMRPLWTGSIPDADDMIKYHYADFPTASSLAAAYSEQLRLDAESLDLEGYGDIAALSARQVLGATYFSGTLSDPILFLKEISSNGNFQTVDVIFPSFPFFLYTNPQWLINLLGPLLEHQLSGQYPNKYSMHDLGAHFPNATGHADGRDEYMPVEECGDMLIMGLAVVNALRHESKQAWLIESHQMPEAEQQILSLESPLHGLTRHDSIDKEGSGLEAVSGESAAKAWVKRAYPMWKQWAGYLIRESLIPRNQLCTDDFAGWLANQTNLALKGIIGIRAMSELSDLVGEKEDAKYYKNISDVYIEKWQEYGLSRDRTHAKLAYTWYGSWTTIYNLFADALLCFHLPSGHGVGSDDAESRQKHFIPNDIYKNQSKWYLSVLQRYGLPLDSRHLYTKSDWEFFAGAITSTKTRQALVESIARWVNETITDRPFTDLYDTEGKGDFSPVRFMARPVVGGHFAPLVLKHACRGQASKGLDFLDAEDDQLVDVAAALAADLEEGVPVSTDDGMEL